MKYYLKTLLAAAAAGPAIMSGALRADFDVTRYGARADGATDNTASIQKAIDECGAAGGGRVVVPGGGTYMTYTLNLRSNVELHIGRGATLKGGEDPLKYPVFETNGVWNAERAPRFNRRAMFYTVGQTNVAITGAGTINGNAEKFHHRAKGRRNWTGHDWWRNSDTNITGRCVFFAGCRDVRLDDVLILHPAGWSTWFLDCDRVGVRGVRVEADRRFPNGDGLHFGGCRDVTVADCIVSSQDDALILRTHQEQMKRPRPCERVTVSNCILNSHGAFAVRIGWTGDGPVRDMSLNNIVSTHSSRGIGFTLPPEPPAPKEYMDPPRGRGLVPPPLSSRLPFHAENIHFSNISIASDESPLLITVGRTERVAFMRGISFSHCTFRSGKPPYASCRVQDNVRDWRFDDVVFDVAAPGDESTDIGKCFPNTSGFRFSDVRLSFLDMQPFWQMEVELDGADGPVVVESAEQRAERRGGRSTYGPLTAGGRTFAIKVTIDEKATPSGKVYTGLVENNEKGARITKFNGPKLDKVALDPARGAIYIPGGLGRRLRHFPSSFRNTAPWTGRGGYMTVETDKYPSRGLTMPWTAIDTGNGTYYAAVHDAAARPKSIGYRWHPDKRQTDVRFRHPVSIRAGEKWILPETVFERMPGDWHDAAKRYRAWHDSARPGVMSAAPAWTRDLTGWLLVIMKQQNEQLMWPYTDIPKLCDVAERNGLNCIGLFGWTVGGHDHLYPDYDPDPKMGGVPALKVGIAEARRRGIRVCIYANGQLQQIGATKFWSEHGKNIALAMRDGSLHVKTYHKYRDIPVYKFALGCLHGAPWAERMSALARQAESLGADAILYDQLGVMPPFECWGRGHGHPTPWSSHAEERPAFIRAVAKGVRSRNPDFSVFTEGLHDSILDSIGFFHSWTPGTLKQDAQHVRARSNETMARSDPFPEMFRYTFPEAAMTTRFATPMAPRLLANYATVFGIRHEIEIRYMPDREYVLEGKVPSRADYGTVNGLPDIGEMHRTDQRTANAYLKSVCDMMRTHAKHLLRGRFVDEDGFTVRGGRTSGPGATVIAKRFVADDGTSAVCAWNISDKPVDVTVDGLGSPTGTSAPSGEKASGPLAPDSIRLYEFAR
jgi:hypothetical protein